MSDLFKKDNLIIFAGGIITGLIRLKVAKTDKVVLQLRKHLPKV